MCSMISGLFYYMVTIFNIIFPFHILLERFSHRTFSPSFYRRLWIFYAVLLSWMIVVSTSTSATFTAFFIYPLWIFHIFFFFTEDRSFQVFLFFIFCISMIFIEAIAVGILMIFNFIFPQLHLAVLYVALSGNTISIVLCSISQMILDILLLPRIFNMIEHNRHLINIKLFFFLGLPVLFMVIAGNIFMSMPEPSFSYGWFIIASVIISIISWNLFNHGLTLLKELEEQHLKEAHQRLTLEKEIHHLHTLDDEYQKLYRWNHDTSNHLLALSLLVEHGEYEQALSYIQELKDSEGKHYETSESV